MRLGVLQIVGIGLSFLASQDVFSALRIVPTEYATIQEAVNATASDDTVLIQVGVYEETVSVPCRPMTIAGEYIFSGDSTDIDFCRWVAPAGHRNIQATVCGAGNSLVIAGLTFSGNSAGGGLDLERGGIVVEKCVFDACSAFAGGALYAADSELQVANCVFTRCHAATTGGVVYLDSVRCVISGSRVEDCGASGPNGALFRFGDRSAYFDNVAVRNCVLPEQRALFDLTGVMDTVLFTSCVISNSVFGYGVYQSSGLCSIFKMERCNFEGNTIRKSIVSDDVLEIGDYLISGCVFRENHSADFIGVAAMFVCHGHYGFFRFTDNLFAYNDWLDESCMFVVFYGNELISRNYFIGNSSSEGIATPCVVYAYGVSENTFRHNVFHDNLTAACAAFVSTEPIAQVQNNYWGDPSGPYHIEMNPAGLGDTVVGDLDFVPWSEDTSFLSTAIESPLPVSIALGYPYPNPFNSEVKIEYALAREQDVRIDIYDVLGRRVSELLGERQGVGVHSVRWDANGFASGLYFARLSSADSRAAQSAKLLLMK
ncbi:MAG: right-handed parallel beta-helix repeat-containing protein [Calditrichaeota bacterium]|nr:right-handed parallel beta-helix repeat-containing protein [Calditrichota bacterium]MCB9369943.1 right-handed parallel beta-helix repeat-containing protein [Calditrichota bacterium]